VGIVITSMFAAGGNTFSKVSQLTSATRCCLCKSDCRIKVKEDRTQTVFSVPVLQYKEVLSTLFL